jgi:dsRNA-specific ribonuclease
MTTELKTFLVNLFKEFNIENRFIKLLTNDNSLKIFTDYVFVHNSMNSENNYEIYEIIGDSILNSVVLWYFFKNYFQLHHSKNVSWLARTKITFTSKHYFNILAQRLNIIQFIKTSNDIHISKSIIEDVFEAFFGAIYVICEKETSFCGTGNEIIYIVIKQLLDQENIVLNTELLFDSKTLLKELFQQNKVLQSTFGDIIYNHDKKFKNNLKTEREKILSKKALDYFKEQHYEINKTIFL